MSKHLLTKSAYVAGLNCEKYLWIYLNQRERLPKPDEATQALFDQGHEIGGLAKSLYPDGIEIDWSAGHDAGIAQTRTAASERRPIFEAGFQDGMTHARADILKPAAGGKWDLIEVKSSSQVKPEHLEDVAFQKHVYEAAGLRIGRCSVMHVNKNYVRRGKVDASGLLTAADVTADIKPLAARVRDTIDKQLEVMSMAAAPDAEIEKDKCDGCELHPECWSFLPERHVFLLYYPGRKPRELMDQGILAIRDIPEDFPLSAKQQIQLDCERTGEPHADRRGIRAFLGQLKYPLFFLDFETFMTAVPAYDELSPYEQVPFQYSLHVVPSPGRRDVHYSYLSDGKADPRPEVLGKLKKQLGGSGSIVAYNATFEINVLKSCAGRFPQYQSWYESIQPRFVDLMRPFRDFHYYHPGQLGSASLKAVLPALTGLSHEGLEISEGGEASLRFREMAFGSGTEARKKEIREALEAYCRQDTAGMIQILDALHRL
jgi:hypothetical protein